MNSAKKYLNLPRTLSVCAAGLFVFVALVGCKSSEEDVYYDVEPQQEYASYDESSANDSYYVQQEDNAVVNPYDDEMVAQTDDTILLEDEEPKGACYQVKDGQIVGKSSHPCSSANLAVPVNGKSVEGTSDAVKTNIVRKANSTINIETPVRCEITGRDNSIISSIPMGSDAFKLVRLDKSDALPRFEVNNYTFKKKPLDMAIQKLVREAGIQVYSDDALFPEVSGEDIRGELSAVINELAGAADAYYRYDASKKQLYLSRWAPFMMKVPGGRIGMYTMLDALRGANLNNFQADFGSNEIYIRLNYEKEKTISGLIETIERSPTLLLFDVQVYRVDATSNPLDWQEVVKDYGVTRINSSVNGIMGRILATSPQKVRQTFVETLGRHASVNLVSEGIAIMPNGWKVRFDIGQCVKSQSPEQKLSMLLQSNILSAEKAESNIALDTPSGEITSFHTIYNTSDTLNIIAVKGKAINPEWSDDIEYIITLQPKLVRLVK